MKSLLAAVAAFALAGSAQAAIIGPDLSAFGTESGNSGQFTIESTAYITSFSLLHNPRQDRWVVSDDGLVNLFFDAESSSWPGSVAKIRRIPTGFIAYWTPPPATSVLHYAGCVEGSCGYTETLDYFSTIMFAADFAPGSEGETWTFKNSISPEHLAGIPEASTWAMMIIGFAGVGTTLRARRRTLVLRPALAR